MQPRSTGTYGRHMTRRTPISALLAAAATVALAACAHSSGTGATSRRSPATEGFGEVSTAPSSPAPDTTNTTDSQTGGGHTTPKATPSASKSTATGPQIVTFTAKGAVCPVDPKPGAPYSSPGQVTISWQISGADTVDLLMDHGLWKSYPGKQGTDTLPFSCDNSKPQTVTHTFTVTIKNTSVSKTISASAKSNPN
ncbi:MAG: hypothetical protein AUI14_23960 [Actinobacteria bacterium 13_2_20CM_2_71_6]|nr:MAG: hypothetical protein AUI14_23960 [Actinobacteria bacterium 13_2_20CM_2_71_6]